MHPDVHDPVPERALRLRDLVLVVRESGARGRLGRARSAAPRSLGKMLTVVVPTVVLAVDSVEKYLVPLMPERLACQYHLSVSGGRLGSAECPKVAVPPR